MQEAIKTSQHQARRFLLRKHGLLGEYRFHGRQGVVDFVRQAGCVQFDPIDVCGKNHELVLAARVKGFSRSLLFSLLYDERVLMDWFDKNQAICLTSDWPMFAHHREAARRQGRSKRDVDAVAEKILDFIRANGPVCSADIGHNDKVDWSWGPTSLARAALDTLYMRGELVLHHKKNTRKFYDLAARHIDTALMDTQSPNQSPDDIAAWQTLRRVGSVGLLHDGASDALLGTGMKAQDRNRAFARLLSEALIRPVEVSGCAKPFYCLESDMPLMREAMSRKAFSPCVEFLAPLDNLLWDRSIVRELFDFDYKWEIYTPKAERKYGYYVLPVLFGEHIVGRIELARNKAAGRFDIQNLWLERGCDQACMALTEQRVTAFSQMLI